MARVPVDAIVAGVVTVLRTDAALGQVDLCPGGPSPWSESNAPAGHWWVDFISTRTQIMTLGNPGSFYARRAWNLVVEGFYPFSEALGSAATWRPMLDRVMAKLEQARTLGLALVLETGPIISSDGVRLHGSANQNDLMALCHYTRITLRYTDEFVVVAAD